MGLKRFFQRKRNEIYIKNGVDAGGGYKDAASGQYFNGRTGNLKDTVVLSGALDLNQTPHQWIAMFKDMTTGVVYSKEFSRELIVGRQYVRADRNQRLVINCYSEISRTHCHIFIRDGLAYLEDLNSTFHTYVMQKKINSPVCIGDNTRVTLGNIKFCVWVHRI